MRVLVSNLRRSSFLAKHINGTGTRITTLSRSYLYGLDSGSIK